MYLLFSLRKWVACQFLKLSILNLLILCTLYIFTSWELLNYAGENHITDSWIDFIYYLVVSASSVGYGDLSPQSAAGKLIVSLFVIPCGISLFAIAIGKMTSSLISQWKKGLLGKKDIAVDNHIIIFGWHQKKTKHLLQMLLHEEANKRKIVLCCDQAIENPMPNRIEFVSVQSYTVAEEIQRTQIETASCVILDTEDDNLTLTLALLCASLNETMHMVAYFKDDNLRKLLKSHCPNAECIPSVATEMLAKSAVDPGSSALHYELLNSTQGMSQYAVHYPENQPVKTFGDLFSQFKSNNNAILIALELNHRIQINPELSIKIHPGMRLFYIADERIDNVVWE